MEFEEDSIMFKILWEGVEHDNLYQISMGYVITSLTSSQNIDLWHACYITFTWMLWKGLSEQDGGRSSCTLRQFLKIGDTSGCTSML